MASTCGVGLGAVRCRRHASPRRSAHSRPLLGRHQALRCRPIPQSEGLAGELPSVGEHARQLPGGLALPPPIDAALSSAPRRRRILEARAPFAVASADEGISPKDRAAARVARIERTPNPGPARQAEAAGPRPGRAARTPFRHRWRRSSLSPTNKFTTEGVMGRNCFIVTALLTGSILAAYPVRGAEVRRTGSAIPTRSRRTG